jgi:hypothetical protein
LEFVFRGEFFKNLMLYGADGSGFRRRIGRHIPDIARTHAQGGGAGLAEEFAPEELRFFEGVGGVAKVQIYRQPGYALFGVGL